MSFYNSPTYYFGSLNPVFNATDYEAQETSTLTEATADDRYLKKSGGILTGSLTVPSVSVSSSISVPSITLSSNSISQTVGQVGYVYSTNISYSISTTQATLVNAIASLSSIPIGVYIVSFMCNFSTSITASTTISKLQFGISTSSSSFTSSTLRDYGTISESVSSQLTLYKTHTFILQQSSSSTLYLNFTTNFGGNSSTIAIGGVFQAVRIA